MLKWQLHQYSGYRKPFVWHVLGATPSGPPLYEFVHAVTTHRSVTGKFGDSEFTINQPGLYKVGNTKNENGYRFVLLHNGIWRYRSIPDEADAIAVARRLQAGERLDDVSEALIETFQWQFPYAPPYRTRASSAAAKSESIGGKR